MSKGRWIFWTVVAVFSIALTLLVYKNKHVGYYEARAALYPNITEDPERGMICHQIKGILASDDFMDIDFHETNSHKINILAYKRDGTEAIAEVKGSLEKACEICKKQSVQCSIVEEPHIVRNPHKAQYALYAVLSFLFSTLVAGAITITWRQFKNQNIKLL